MARAYYLTDEDKKFLRSNNKGGFNKNVYYERITLATVDTLRELGTLLDARRDYSDEEIAAFENVKSKAEARLKELLDQKKLHMAEIEKAKGADFKQIEKQVAHIDEEINIITDQLNKFSALNKAYVLSREKYKEVLSPHILKEFMHMTINAPNRCDSNGQSDNELDLYGAELAAMCLDYSIRKLERQWHTAIDSNKEHLYEFENMAFQEDKTGVLSWSHMVLDKVRLAAEQQHKK